MIRHDKFGRTIPSMPRFPDPDKWIRITLDPPHWNGIAGHALRDCLLTHIVPYRVRKHQWRRRYYDRHALTRPPRAVHREECWVCRNLYAEASMVYCVWCEENLLCPNCREDHVGFCTEDCMVDHQYSIAGIGRR